MNEGLRKEKHANPKVMSRQSKKEGLGVQWKKRSGVHCLPRKATLWSTQTVVVQDAAIYTAVEGEEE
jgi:hypothetical protein